MEKTLRAENALPLTSLYLATVLLVAAIHWGVHDVFELTEELGTQVLVVTAITTIGGLISNFLPNQLKHPLVYWRIRNVLSGHRCRRICERDPRLLADDLERKWPELFLHEMSEDKQNAYWYQKIYRTVRNEPEVKQAHKNFLLFRDASAGVFLLFVGMLFWHLLSEFVGMQSISFWSTSTLVGIFLLMSQVARQSGDRMVVNTVVVALNAPQPSEEA